MRNKAFFCDLNFSSATSHIIFFAALWSGQTTEVFGISDNCKCEFDLDSNTLHENRKMLF